ncbi:Guanine-nucleotide dissociation stimulator CDC25 domain-containing protein [Rozella allomycis CSF55]|uniref:Guanine-nucleotide dissociation stimulator CDC25 domain-containing protein n=1 Tax=Rozella allomycis (strain CSF55) TaxID=988480 RepID=A0A075APP9_ROZAC|nr:Guanine-nucleotide dissociation stimulator CDC25 domain-containing protein [Rozella allomycis CSF55]|eukprot:EPZ32106.1 Guanine-nucleotide dissociation stimulator CDC25 domain-containing protein [Rozella allomycis CSF55]
MPQRSLSIDSLKQIVTQNSSKNRSKSLDSIQCHDLNTHQEYTDAISLKIVFDNVIYSFILQSSDTTKTNLQFDGYQTRKLDEYYLGYIKNSHNVKLMETLPEGCQLYDELQKTKISRLFICFKNALSSICISDEKGLMSKIEYSYYDSVKEIIDKKLKNVKNNQEFGLYVPNWDTWLNLNYKLTQYYFEPNHVVHVRQMNQLIETSVIYKANIYHIKVFLNETAAKCISLLRLQLPDAERKGCGFYLYSKTTDTVIPQDELVCMFYNFKLELIKPFSQMKLREINGRDMAMHFENKPCNTIKDLNSLLFYATPRGSYDHCLAYTNSLKTLSSASNLSNLIGETLMISPKLCKIFIHLYLEVEIVCFFKVCFAKPLAYYIPWNVIKLQSIVYEKDKNSLVHVKEDSNFVKTMMFTYRLHSTPATFFKGLKESYFLVRNFKTKFFHAFEQERDSKQLKLCQILQIWTKQYSRDFQDVKSTEFVLDEMELFIRETVFYDHPSIAQHLLINIVNIDKHKEDSTGHQTIIAVGIKLYVHRSTGLFNQSKFVSHLVLWLVSSILHDSNPHIVIEKVIKIAAELHTFKDFSGLMACIAALNHGAIQRLKAEFEKVDRKLIKKFGDLEKLMSTESSYKNYRAHLKNCSGPIVPYM